MLREKAVHFVIGRDERISIFTVNTIRQYLNSIMINDHVQTEPHVYDNFALPLFSPLPHQAVNNTISNIRNCVITI